MSSEQKKDKADLHDTSGEESREPTPQKSVEEESSSSSTSTSSTSQSDATLLTIKPSSTSESLPSTSLGEESCKPTAVEDESSSSSTSSAGQSDATPSTIKSTLQIEPQPSTSSGSAIRCSVIRSTADYLKETQKSTKEGWLKRKRSLRQLKLQPTESSEGVISDQKAGGDQFPYPTPPPPTLEQQLFGEISDSDTEDDSDDYDIQFTSTSSNDSPNASANKLDGLEVNKNVQPLLANVQAPVEESRAVEGNEDSDTDDDAAQNPDRPQQHGDVVPAAQIPLPRIRPNFPGPEGDHNAPCVNANVSLIHGNLRPVPIVALIPCGSASSSGFVPNAGGDGLHMDLNPPPHNNASNNPPPEDEYFGEPQFREFPRRNFHYGADDDNYADPNAQQALNDGDDGNDPPANGNGYNPHLEDCHDDENDHEEELDSDDDPGDNEHVAEIPPNAIAPADGANIVINIGVRDEVLQFPIHFERPLLLGNGAIFDYDIQYGDNGDVELAHEEPVAGMVPQPGNSSGQLQPAIQQAAQAENFSNDSPLQPGRLQPGCWHFANDSLAQPSTSSGLQAATQQVGLPRCWCTHLNNGSLSQSNGLQPAIQPEGWRRPTANESLPERGYNSELQPAVLQADQPGSRHLANDSPPQLDDYLAMEPGNARPFGLFQGAAVEVNRASSESENGEENVAPQAHQNPQPVQAEPNNLAELIVDAMNDNAINDQNLSDNEDPEQIIGDAQLNVNPALVENYHHHQFLHNYLQNHAAPINPYNHYWYHQHMHLFDQNQMVDLNAGGDHFGVNDHFEEDFHAWHPPVPPPVAPLPLVIGEDDDTTTSSSSSSAGDADDEDDVLMGYNQFLGRFYRGQDDDDSDAEGHHHNNNAVLPQAH